MGAVMKHWTSRSAKDFVYRISADFILQVEKKMEEEGMNQKALAARLRVSSGRVSQVLRNPGNVTLRKIVDYARVLGLKVSIVAYDDGDPQNINGPINAEIFNLCWQRAGSPKDFFALDSFTSDVRPLGPIYQIYFSGYQNRSNTSKDWMAISCDPKKTFSLTTSADKITRAIPERSLINA
jgi:transcriptional regulator with XRE-family HTH domain